MTPGGSSDGVAAIRAGELDVVSDDYRQLTGCDPLTIEQIVERDMT